MDHFGIRAYLAGNQRGPRTHPGSGRNDGRALQHGVGQQGDIEFDLDIDVDPH